MRIGLLRCDDIFEELRPEYGGYLQLFENLFTAADAAAAPRIAPPAAAAAAPVTPPRPRLSPPPAAHH